MVTYVKWQQPLVKTGKYRAQAVKKAPSNPTSLSHLSPTCRIICH
ncbi:hypothetical protein [methane-oxidizing endosymbiont of Gigantopelta aegis]|nr:hypothetical protein [methane-oxidizing endosymbiont of Gigantopelta aegis]